MQPVKITYLPTEPKSLVVIQGGKIIAAVDLRYPPDGWFERCRRALEVSP